MRIYVKSKYLQALGNKASPILIVGDSFPKVEINEVLEWGIR